MQSRSWQWSIPLLAAALVAGWWWGKSPSAATESGVAQTEADEAVRFGSVATPTRPQADAVLPGGYAGPDPASLGPAERGAFRDAEIKRSASAAAPTTFKDIDGRRRAFRYPDPVAAVSADRMQQARREQLMRELEADPARFARKHRLSLKQVRWIVDGEADFPDRLLDPP